MLEKCLGESVSSCHRSVRFAGDENYAVAACALTRSPRRRPTLPRSRSDEWNTSHSGATPRGCVRVRTGVHSRCPQSSAVGRTEPGRGSNHLSSVDQGTSRSSGRGSWRNAEPRERSVCPEIGEEQIFDTRFPWSVRERLQED